MAVDTVQVDNADMWSSATAPTEAPSQEAPTVAPEPPTPEPGPQERARDELGRFAKQEVTDAPPTHVQPAEKPEEAAVPSWRLREIREERDAASKRLEEFQRQFAQDRQQMAELQRQLQELRQPKPEPVDIWQNPDGYVKQQFAPFEQQIAELRAQTLLNSSKALAIAQYGAPAVAEMEQAIEEAYAKDREGMQRTLGFQMQNSGDPIGIAMKWFQGEKLQKEIGGDLNAYKSRLQETLLKDPAFLAKAIEAAKGQAQAQPSNIKLPVSLSKVAGTAGNTGDDNDDSNDGMWRSATAGMRR